MRASGFTQKGKGGYLHLFGISAYQNEHGRRFVVGLLFESRLRPGPHLSPATLIVSGVYS